MSIFKGKVLMITGFQWFFNDCRKQYFSVKL